MSYMLLPGESYTHDDGEEPVVVFHNGTDRALSFSLRVYAAEPKKLHVFVGGVDK